MPPTVTAPSSSALYYHRPPRPLLHCLYLTVAYALLLSPVLARPFSPHRHHPRPPPLLTATSKTSSSSSLPPTPNTLSNVSVVCCVLVKHPYVFPVSTPTLSSSSFPTSVDNRTQHYDGWTLRNFRHLVNKTGLSCATTFVQHEWTEQDVVDQLASCRDDYATCNCTLVVGEFSERVETHGLVKFLPDNGFDSVVVLTRVENTQNSQSSGIIFGAFEPTVWAAIVALMVMYTALKMLDTRFSPRVRASAGDEDEDENGRDRGTSEYTHHSGVHEHAQVRRQRQQTLLHECQQQQQAVTAAELFGRWMKKGRKVMMKNPFYYRLRKSIQSTIGLMLGYSRQIDGEDKSMRMWVINVSIVLSGLFLFLVYEASMVARLVQEDGTASSYVSRKNLAHCDIPDERICMLQDSWEHQFWIDSMLDQECRSPNHRPSPRLAANESALVSLVTRHVCDFMLADGPLATRIISTRCGSIVRTGDLVVSRSMGFIVPLSSPYQDELSRAILQITEENEMPSLHDYLQELNTCRRVMLPTLSFRRLGSFFTIVFVACLIVVAWMIVDRQTPLPASGGGESC